MTSRTDSLGQVTSAVRKWSDGAPVAGQQYGFLFDDIGNRQTATVNSNVSEYAANLLNQYTQRTVPGFVDILGSVASNATVTVNGTTAGRQGAYFRHELALANTNGAAYSSVAIIASMTSGTNNLVVTNTGSAFLPKTPEIFNHDSDGSLTNDGRWAYTWDGENRLLGMETLPNLSTNVPVQKLIFQYDAQSRRISKVVSNFNGSTWSEVANLRFVYDGWNLIAELDGTNGLVRSYTWGLDLSGSPQGAGGVGGLLSVTGTNGTHFVAFDGNGNVTALVDAGSGSISAQYEWSPFGEMIRATGPMAKANPFRFSTKYQDDETGLLDYGFRYYQPSTGRWLSRDPLEEYGGITLYGVIGNDLIDDGDYLGLEVLTHATQTAEVAARIFEEGLKPGIEVGGRWPNIWMAGEGAYVPPNGVNLRYDINVSSVKEVPCNVIEQALKAGGAAKSGPGRGNAIWRHINDWIQSQPDGAWKVPVDKTGRLAEVGKGEGYHYAFKSSNAWRLFKPRFLQVTGARGVKIPKYTRVGGKVLVALGIAMDVYEISTAEDKARTIVSVYYGWTGAIVGAKAGAALGAPIGGAIGVWAFGAGAVPGAGIGGAVLGIAGGVGGYFGGRRVGEIVYDSIIESGFTYY